MKKLTIAIIFVMCIFSNARAGGLKNFRKATDGLYRSACLYNLSSKDIATIRNAGINVGIDLRTTAEREEKPDTRMDGIEYMAMPIFDESVIGITREEGTDPKSVLRNMKGREALRARIPDMPQLYRTMMTDCTCRSNIENVLDTIDSLRSAGQTVLVHCTAGKDRAGVVSALAMLRDGRSMDEVMADYLESDKASRKDARTKSLLVLLFKFDPVAARMVRDTYSAKPEYLQAALDVLD